MIIHDTFLFIYFGTLCYNEIEAKKPRKEKEMKFFEKLGRVLVKNIAYTVVFIVALILFLYFAGGDLIGGILTALSALVVYICGAMLCQEYNQMYPKKSEPKKSSAKKSNKKK